MPNMTFALPDELHREIRAHPEIKWAEVARQALRRELDRIHTYDRLLAGSTMTEADAVELGRKLRRGAAERARR